MYISKVLSTMALFLLTCQAICGLHLSVNPTVAADGGSGFHLVLGLSTLVVALAAVISVFRSQKKSA